MARPADHRGSDGRARHCWARPCARRATSHYASIVKMAFPFPVMPDPPARGPHSHCQFEVSQVMIWQLLKPSRVKSATGGAADVRTPAVTLRDMASFTIDRQRYEDECWRRFSPACSLNRQTELCRVGQLPAPLSSVVKKRPRELGTEYLHISVRHLDDRVLKCLSADFGIESASFRRSPASLATLPV